MVEGRQVAGRKASRRVEFVLHNHTVARTIKPGPQVRKFRTECTALIENGPQQLANGQICCRLRLDHVGNRYQQQIKIGSFLYARKNADASTQSLDFGGKLG